MSAPGGSRRRVSFREQAVHMAKSLTHWLRSLVQAKETPSSRDVGRLEERLQALEREAEEGEGAVSGGALNRAGDLCFRGGQRERALHYYGGAIDAFLEDHRPESARAVAQKLIRLHPRAVRTLCTLTWLDLGTGHRGDALEHLEEYVAAALRSGDQDLAIGQVLEMARIVDDEELRAAAAAGLDRLEAPAEATSVREWMEGEGEQPEAVPEAELPTRCFQAAVRSNRRRRGHEAA